MRLRSRINLTVLAVFGGLAAAAALVTDRWVAHRPAATRVRRYASTSAPSGTSTTTVGRT